MFNFSELHTGREAPMSDRRRLPTMPGPGSRGEPYARGRGADQRPCVGRPEALCLLVLAALVAGCASDEEREANATFGESVRLAIALQTAPPGAPGNGLDAVKSAAVLKAYREDVAERKKVEDNLIFKVGQ